MENTAAKLIRIARKSQEEPGYRFTFLKYLLNEAYLQECYHDLKTGKAAGIDGRTLESYTEEEMVQVIAETIQKMKENQYRPQPVRRVRIPKENGKERMLGIPTVIDKVVQLACTRILESIYEQTFLQTGIRVGELVNLKTDDIDLENKLLIVRQGKGKKDRSIPLEEQALSAISKYLQVREKTDSEYVFLARNGTSLDVRSIRYLVKKYLGKAGIDKRASVHTLRHTFGTHKVDKGMTIPALQELLGHKKMETTYKYVHLAKTTLRAQQEGTHILVIPKEDLFD